MDATQVASDPSDDETGEDFVVATFKVLPSDLDRLDAIAKLVRASRSELIRQAIVAFVERAEQMPEEARNRPLLVRELTLAFLHQYIRNVHPDLLPAALEEAHGYVEKFRG